MTTINLQAARRDIQIEQGKSIEINFAVTRNNVPLDCTGFVARGQVRTPYPAGTLIMSLTQANNRVVWVSQAGGTFKVVIEPAATTGGALQFTRESPTIVNAVYDIEIESPSGVIYPVCKGNFQVYREVTTIS